MKRHAQLQPLSDDHHQALVLARRARRAAEAAAKGDAGELAKTWPDVVARFASELEPHFHVEERWLFPLVEAAGGRALGDRARADHARLRELIRAEPDAAGALELASVLERHVRFEERELFPFAEALLGPDVPALARDLAEAVRAACADAALAGYEDASLSGLCREGAWEAAIGAIRSAPLEAVTDRVLERLLPKP